MMKVKNYLLNYRNMYIFQDTEMFNFSLDSVLLPNFVTINKKHKKIMDIGCGNAPIPLILSTRTKAKIIGVEIQKESYELAVESVEVNNLSDQIEIINSDINELVIRIKALIINDNKIALLHINCTEPDFGYRNHLETPGGGIEDEEDPIEALKREIMEETGFIVKDIEYLTRSTNH